MSCSLLYHDDFTEGIGAWTTLTGTNGAFNILTGGTYGSYMHHDGPATGSEVIAQNIIALTNVNRYDVKVQITSSGAQGSGYLAAYDGSANGPIIIPADNASNQANNWCGVNPGSGTVYFGLALGVGEWYQISVNYSATSGQSTATLTDLGTNQLIATITFPGVQAFRNIQQLRFAQGASSQEAGVSYSDIELFNCTGGDYVALDSESGAAADTSGAVLGYGKTGSIVETMAALDASSASIYVPPAPPPPPPPPPAPPAKANAVLSLQRIIPVNENFS